MSRLLGELRETDGKPRPAGRALARFAAALGVVWGGLASGSCLVTNEFDFATPDTPPRLVAISPPKFTRVKNFSDSDCLDRPDDSMLFRATIVEPDPAQSVYVHLFVNGIGVEESEQLPFSPTASQGISYSACVPHTKLEDLCSRVQLITGHVLSDVRTAPVDGAINPRYNQVEWTVLGKSRDNADANPTDCARLFDQDAGIDTPFPDGSIVAPPVDGGTLFPVGMTPAPGDGGA